MKFLITRFSSIGDIVLTTPVVRCLKKQVVTAEIHFLTKAAFKPVVEANPYIDKIHYLQDDIASVIEEIKREDVDYVIDLHHNLRSLRIKKGLGKRSFSFNKLNIEKWLFTSLKWNQLPNKHIVDRYLETVAQFGVRNDNAGLDYFIPEKDKVKETDIPASHHAGYIGVVIGAAHNTKKMPLHKLQELCASIQHPVMLLGGKEDTDEGNQIASIDVHKIYNACGKFNINESADLVRRSKMIITHDTGLMHIAAAFRKPILSIWGNTVPAFGMYPYFGLVRNPSELPYRIVEVNGLSCRPCSKIGYDKCPKKHFKCMELQNIDAMIWQTNEWLGRI